MVTVNVAVDVEPSALVAVTVTVQLVVDSASNPDESAIVIAPLVESMASSPVHD